MKQHILFVDGIDSVYEPSSLGKQTKIGGTEITVMRVAEILSATFKVTVAQLGRDTDQTVNGVRYIPLKDALQKNSDIDIAVVIRTRRLAKTIAMQYPKIKVFYWMHDIPSSRLWKYKRAFSKYRCDIIAISEFQKNYIQNIWRGNIWQRIFDKVLPISSPRLHVIYNPLDAVLKPDATPVIHNKLLFSSAPDRGIQEILENFRRVRSVMKNLELFITSPGYADEKTLQKSVDLHGVYFLGRLPHHEFIQHLREAFCVFYPQTTRFECFGLVYAEANAVGTPVLAHDFGAAREVLSDPSQLINANDSEMLIERLQQWQNGARPMVKGKIEFQREAVLRAWSMLMLISN